MHNTPFIIFNLEEEQKTAVVAKLISRSSPRQEFFVMMILASAMATFGIMMGSSVVIIGSMLVAPLLSPILSIALGIVMSDFKLIKRSSYVVLRSVAFAIGVSAVLALFLSTSAIDQELLKVFQPSLLFFGVAFVAGLAASLSSMKENLSEFLPGVAIAVSLIPPISMIGIGIARFNWILISSSLMLFVINIVGIVFAAMIVFSLAHFYVKREEATKVIKREDEQIAKEEKVAEGARKSN